MRVIGSQVIECQKFFIIKLEDIISIEPQPKIESYLAEVPIKVRYDQQTDGLLL